MVSLSSLLPHSREKTTAQNAESSYLFLLNLIAINYALDLVKTKDHFKTINSWILLYNYFQDAFPF